MSQETAMEKRRHTRKKFEKPIHIYQITGSIANKAFFISGTPIVGRSKDLSVDGMQLQLPHNETLSKTLKLSFELERNQFLEVYSKQVWKDDHLCGLQFIIWNDGLRQHLQSYLAP
ncbi:MAG TPA: PilZ domain-containing protein [bacterium]|jgi:hypothetical protein|nr:PilZ domain-containing protein [bacterium]